LLMDSSHAKQFAKESKTSAQLTESNFRQLKQ
jgi:hypothetical protein